jgi:DNA-binding LytR/AlgR family response regulator
MEKELKCLLLDDELPGLTYLKMLCEQIKGLRVVKSFIDPERFLAEFPQLDFDLCIIDIEMPKFDGLQVANLLQGKPVIFATAYKDYAAEAFDLNAVDYLRKPVSLDRLKRAIDKARTLAAVQQQDKSRFFSCNTDKGRARIPVDQLTWIGTSPTESRDKIAHLKDGSALVLKNISFESLLLSLPEAFVRINKQEMVNLNIVRFFSHDQITTVLNLDSGKPLLLNLSERFREEFLRKVNF